MFNDIFVNILVYGNMYKDLIIYAVIGVFGFYYVKLQAFPLVTREPSELVIQLLPGKAKFYKVTHRGAPMFGIGKNAYWFSRGLPIGQNIVHIVVEPVDQEIYDLDRNQRKIIDLITHREKVRQVVPHKSFLPWSKLAFKKNWKLIVHKRTEADPADPKKSIVYVSATLEPTREKQPYKISMFKRIGVYEEKEFQVVDTTENESSNGETVTELQQVTMQAVVEQVGDLVQNANFSAAFAGKIMRSIRRMEQNWIMTLTGAMDMRVILVIIIMIAGIVLFFMLYKQPSLSSLPPPPPSVHISGQ